MIRELQRADINRVAEIWLNTNLKAHDFIPVQECIGIAHPLFLRWNGWKYLPLTRMILLRKRINQASEKLCCPMRLLIGGGIN